MIPKDVMEKLERVGWVYISSRTTANGLVLHTLGRGRMTSPLVRTWEETEERSVEGWAWEAELG
jgi:hypothetical protein